MIDLTHMNGDLFTLNCEMIETVESKPDTTITLFNGRKYIVREKTPVVIEKILVYKREAYSIYGSVSAWERCQKKESEPCCED